LFDDICREKKRLGKSHWNTNANKKFAVPRGASQAFDNLRKTVELVNKQKVMVSDSPAQKPVLTNHFWLTLRLIAGDKLLTVFKSLYRSENIFILYSSQTRCLIWSNEIQ